jgi:excisionase family DNA binding protein
MARLESSLANQLDAPAFSISQAAEMVNLSDSHIRRAIYKRDLPASNVGSTARPLWRIMRSDLIAWMESKKGGDPKIPPRSDLKALIDRHLPGLRGRKESATR